MKLDEIEAVQNYTSWGVPNSGRISRQGDLLGKGKGGGVVSIQNVKMKKIMQYKNYANFKYIFPYKGAGNS